MISPPQFWRTFSSLGPPGDGRYTFTPTFMQNYCLPNDLVKRSLAFNHCTLTRPPFRRNSYLRVENIRGTGDIARTPAALAAHHKRNTAERSGGTLTAHPQPT